MKLTKADTDRMAKALTERLLCNAGLANAKKIVVQIKKNLMAEYMRRKNL